MTKLEENHYHAAIAMLLRLNSKRPVLTDGQTNALLTYRAEFERMRVFIRGLADETRVFREQGEMSIERAE